MDLNQDQLNQLHSLGIKSPTPSGSPIFPLLSVSGITLISFGGLLLLKNQLSSPSHPKPSPNNQPTPGLPRNGGVPKSIQHYLLASQQYFSQALQSQQSCTGGPTCPPSQPETINLLNQSLLTATDAIKNFPSDYRGYYQRGRVYQSLLESQLASPKPSGDGGPQFLDLAIADISHASSLNPDSAEITRDLATLFAKKGDASNTLLYLSKTVSLEPTRAQNFYDLAKVQQQTGLIREALDTYNRLLPLVTDSSQRQIVETEKTSLESLLSQNPNPLSAPTNTPGWSPAAEGDDTPAPLIQATTSSGLIIAAPETSKDISVSDLTSSNAFSGTATLPADTPSLTLDNSHLTTTSQVYLTITKGGKNQILRLLNKTDSSFTVGLDSPASEDIEFKWWIVN